MGVPFVAKIPIKSRSAINFISGFPEINIWGGEGGVGGAKYFISGFRDTKISKNYQKLPKNFKKVGQIQK